MKTHSTNLLLHGEFPSRHRPGKRSIYSLLLTLISSPMISLSQSASIDDHRNEFAVDVPIVLTPTRLPQRLDESPSAVTIIDRDMIEASGARRLVDVLRLVPGFQVGFKSNHLPTASYHGLADEYSRRLLLLVDGQRIFQYSRGVVEWNNIPIQLEDIERIEVVRGPNAAAYGSNAFEAIVNIQTGSATEYQGLYSRAAGGDEGIADGFFRYGGKLGVMDYALSLASKGEHGYAGINDDRRNNSLYLRGEIPMTAFGELKLQAGYSQADYGIEDGPAYPRLPRNFDVTDNFQSLQWRQDLGTQDELVATFSHNVFHYGDKGFTSRRLIPGLDLNVEFEIEEERFEAELQYSRNFSTQWRAVTGIGYHREQGEAPFYFDTDETLENAVFRLFGHVEHRPREDLVINAGAMLERSTISEAWLFLPRLSVNYHLTDQQTIRAGFSTGSRQPTLYENQGRAVIRGVNVPITLYRVLATGIDRGDLNPEINRAYELGYLWQPATGISVGANLFWEKLSDLIVAFYRPEHEFMTVNPGNRVLDFANERDLTVRGLEAQLDWHNTKGTRIFASYGLTDIDANGTRYNNGYQDSAPQHAFALLVRQNFGEGWQASLNYDYQSGMTWYFDEPIGAYHKLDVRIAKEFKLAGGRAVAELIGTNLAGSVHDYLPTRAWDRSVFLRLTLAY